VTRLLLAALTIALTAPAARAADDTPRERERYRLHCSGCHGEDGRGTPGVTPSLHGLARLARSDEGRAYLARVPGVAQAPVDDDDLADLLNWVIAEFSEEPLTPPYSAKEIGALRQHPLRDPARARPAP
jgi:mono/diheme cytochrome c family protein